MCVCVYKSEQDSALTVHSFEFKFDMYVTGHRRTNFINFGECFIHSFFYESTENNSDTLRPIHCQMKRLKKWLNL